MSSYLCGVRFSMKMQCFSTNFFGSSPSLIPLQLPSRMETHLWYVLPSEIKSEELVNQYLELISPCEREHVFSMNSDELRKGALLARALVRTTIARYQINNVSPRTLKFRKNIHGKPEVEWLQNEDWVPPQLHFNVSHTAYLVACGVTMDHPFAQRYFSPQEVQLLNSISDPELQRQEFIKLWMLKACCQGSDMVVESMEGPTKCASNWQFSLLELAVLIILPFALKRIVLLKGKGAFQ